MSGRLRALSRFFFTASRNARFSSASSMRMLPSAAPSSRRWVT